MKNTMRLCIALSALCFGIAAQADFLTSSDSMVNPTVIDFEAQPTVGNVPGPIQIGTPVGLDIEFSGIPNTGLYTNTGWGLGDNGSWNRTNLGVNDARPGSMLIAFNDGPVASVGGFMNHAPNFGADLEIRALDAGMSVLEEYNVTSLAPIVTPGGVDDGAFRGISRLTPDIHYFEVVGYVQVLDDLTFSGQGLDTTPVPSLSAWSRIGLTLMVLLAGLMVVRRFRGHSA